MFSKTIMALSRRVGDVLLERNIQCAVAESCTGGGLAFAMTAIPGSSQWFDRGFVTYSNASKSDALGVPKSLIDTHGAVSETVVRSMAEGVLHNSLAHVSVAISGVAGPSGGTATCPVGTVWIAWAGTNQSTKALVYEFSDRRAFVREQAILTSLKGLIDYCER